MSRVMIFSTKKAYYGMTIAQSHRAALITRIESISIFATGHGAAQHNGGQCGVLWTWPDIPSSSVMKTWAVERGPSLTFGSELSSSRENVSSSSSHMVSWDSVTRTLLLVSPGEKVIDPDCGLKSLSVERKSHSLWNRKSSFIHVTTFLSLTYHEVWPI